MVFRGYPNWKERDGIPKTRVLITSFFIDALQTWLPMFWRWKSLRWSSYQISCRILAPSPGKCLGLNLRRWNTGAWWFCFLFQIITMFLNLGPHKKAIKAIILRKAPLLFLLSFCSGWSCMIRSHVHIVFLIVRMSCTSIWRLGRIIIHDKPITIIRNHLITFLIFFAWCDVTLHFMNWSRWIL